jgi:hypothetical protein
MQVRRIYWGRHNGRVKCTFTSALIDSFSIVLVTVSEGDEANSTNPNFRFVGDANIRVENISPSFEKVVFIISVDWGEPLPIWTDLVILDEKPQGFLRAR